MLAPVAVARHLKIQCFRLAQNSKFPARAFSLVLDGDQKLFERNVLRGAAGGQGVAGAGEMEMLRGERNLHNPSTAIPSTGLGGWRTYSCGSRRESGRSEE